MPNWMASSAGKLRLTGGLLRGLGDPERRNLVGRPQSQLLKSIAGVCSGNLVASLGLALRINRPRLVYLWQTTEGSSAAFVRPRSYGLSVFYFEYDIACCDRSRTRGAALFPPILKQRARSPAQAIINGQRRSSATAADFTVAASGERRLWCPRSGSNQSS